MNKETVLCCHIWLQKIIHMPWFYFLKRDGVETVDSPWLESAWLQPSDAQVLHCGISILSWFLWTQLHSKSQQQHQQTPEQKTGPPNSHLTTRGRVAERCIPRSVCICRGTRGNGRSSRWAMRDIIQLIISHGLLICSIYVSESA